MPKTLNIFEIKMRYFQNLGEPDLGVSIYPLLTSRPYN